MLCSAARSQAGELQSLRHKFQNQQSRLQEILVCLDVGMTYLYDAKQLKEYFAVSKFSFSFSFYLQKKNKITSIN